MTIERLRELCADDTIAMTQHAASRLWERRIKLDEIKQAIMCGEIIESYPSDYPYPSALVLGATVAGRRLHVVCGIGGGFLWIVTAYEPDASKWEDDMKTRKAAE